jgi:hypothetical protein
MVNDRLLVKTFLKNGNEKHALPHSRLNNATADPEDGNVNPTFTHHPP